MAVVREELSLTQEQIGNIIISSVAITILARLLIGYLCDRFGPRNTYTVLLILGSFPLMLIGLSNSYGSFLIFRLCIGAIGAAFVITQYHTSLMFASNVVGTANATSAGWGNLGGGVTQMVMPLVFAGFVALGFADADAWRYAMVIPGVALLVMGLLYYRLTQDTPEGNFKEIRKKEKSKDKNAFLKAAADSRVWILFLVYGACFGIELTIHNIAAIYFADNFSLDLKTAGLIAGIFGLMNIFSRTIGGFFADKSGMKWGLKGRIIFLGLVLFLQGLALMLFSQMDLLLLAIISMLLLGVLVQMASGATFSVVPFVNKKAIGSVSGIVGAGGNAGAVAAGFLLKEVAYGEALFILGIIVSGISFLSLLIKFSPENELEALLEQKKLRVKQDPLIELAEA